tara:strand:- start:326 stop:559 length:234 start_codon:yes stop_codon:yes gene_type:complete
MEIPDRIMEEMKDLIPGLEGTDDWMILKKLLLRSIPSNLRTLFSTRHPKTKKQSLNDFELRLIDEYKSMTGVLLVLK